MIYRNLDLNLNFEHLKKTFYNKKKKKILTIYSNGTFYIWKISLKLVFKKKFFFFPNKKERINNLTKCGVGKIACLTMSGNIMIIDIFFLKKLLTIKTKNSLIALCYVPRYLVGLSEKGNLYIFTGNNFHNCSLISIEKNEISNICNKKNNVFLCVHKNQHLTELNIEKGNIQKNFSINCFFKSNISIIKNYQGIIVIVLKNGEIFLLDNFYRIFKKIENNQLKLGEIICILNIHKNYFYFSTDKGFLCVFNLKQNSNSALLVKKISNYVMIGLHLIKNKFFFGLDIKGNYYFFTAKNFFLCEKMLKQKIKWITEKNLSLNKEYIVFFIENFLLIWINSNLHFNEQPSIIIKLNNCVDIDNFCFLAPEKNIIVTTFCLKNKKRITKFFKIKQFQKFYLFLELNIIIEKKKNKIPISNKIIFSPECNILSGIIKNRKKIFILTLKKNKTNLLFIKISSINLIYKYEEFSNLALLENKLILLTKLNSILIFNYKEGFLYFKKNFRFSEPIRSIATGFIKNRAITFLYKSGKIEVYKASHRKLFRLGQIFFSYFDLKSINFFGYNNQNALLLVEKGFVIIPFFFNIKKNKISRIFSIYFFQLDKMIFPLILRTKTWINKLIVLSC
nr:hypothetical protein Cry52Nrm3_p048 [Cryptomonas curvata]